MVNCPLPPPLPLLLRERKGSTSNEAGKVDNTLVGQHICIKAVHIDLQNL